MTRDRKCTLLVAAACLLIALQQLPVASARPDRASIACSMYVSPCHCGLCPRIVDCAKNPTAECFCGTHSPGIYPHPTDQSKFWMCSFDTQSHIPYGVEVPCPSRLVFDPVVKVCTVPAAVSPAPTSPPTSTNTPPPSQPATPPAASNTKDNKDSNSSKEANTKDTNSNKAGDSSNKDNKDTNSNSSSNKAAGSGISGGKWPHWVGVVEDRSAAYRRASVGTAKHSSNRP